jgi:hypothetical protein
MDLPDICRKIGRLSTCGLANWSGKSGNWSWCVENCGKAAKATGEA